MRIDHPVLRGFEFTGEFREPVTGDFYWNGFAVEERGPGDWPFKQPRLILRKVRSTDLGDYELTGDYRSPLLDEPYLHGLHGGHGGSVVWFGPARTAYPPFSAYHILRERRA